MTNASQLSSDPLNPEINREPLSQISSQNNLNSDFNTNASEISQNIPKITPNRKHRPKFEKIERITDEIFEQLQKEFLSFLNSFSSQNESENNVSRYDYVNQASKMAQNISNTMYIRLNHVLKHNRDLGNAIIEEYQRFEPALQKAVRLFMKEHFPSHLKMDDSDQERSFFVSFSDIASVSAIRDLKTEQIGQLMSISGTVTRTTEVRPELLFGAFSCKECGVEIFDVEQQFLYSEPTQCSNPYCQNMRSWSLDMISSRFVDWQRIRLQENATEIPAGSMPRYIDVILRNEEVEKAKPGDKCVFTGSLIVVPDVGQLLGGAMATKTGGNRVNTNYQGVVGLRSLGVRYLNYKMVFMANNVILTHKEFDQTNIREDSEISREAILEDMSNEERHEILTIGDSPNVYLRLAESMAPNVFGHLEIKKGILLMLMGGVHKETSDGIQLRGDINICIVGDPSTAKSQFLKYVCSFLPRAVYTSGKASSAAGLTASVVKDVETGEFGIEAGALMLADNGICCIDEFDKMDPKDQAAIHEAMEQQTISITKAGINATLNARTSILAAANPVFGRYDLSRTLKDNIDISPPIMSRFDLFFVITDTCDEVVDYNVARHIVSIHQQKEKALNPDFTKHQIQNYIRYARSIKPKFTEESYRLAVKYYKDMRSADCGGAKSAYRITVRQLESMIRLSEALARVELKDDVLPNHVKEAARLLKKSIIPVHSEDVDIEFYNEKSNTKITSDESQSFTKMGISENISQETSQISLSQKRTKLSFEEYKKISQMLVYHIRRQEQRSEIWKGISEGDLIEWYLEKCHDSGLFSGEEDIIVASQVARFVIRRLVKIDKVLITIQEPKNPEENNARILDVHPNFDPETTQDSAPLPQISETDKFNNLIDTNLSQKRKENVSNDFEPLSKRLKEKMKDKKRRK